MRVTGNFCAKNKEPTQEESTLFAGGAVRVAAAAVILSLSAGCGTLVSTNSKHFIIVHKEGYPISLDRKPLTPNEFKGSIWPAIQRAIDQHIQDAEEAKKIPRLLLYVHGGLNTYRGALEHEDTVLKAQGTLQKPGLKHLSEHHLLFITWDSSLATSVLDDLFLIRLGQQRLVQGPLSSPFITGARLAQSAWLAPQSLYLQLANAIEAVRVDDDRKWRECAPGPIGEVSDAWIGPNTLTFFCLVPA